MKGAWPEECLKASLLWREKKCFKALNSGQTKIKTSFKTNW